MCQTKFIKGISVPAINSNFVLAQVWRSDELIVEFRTKLLTQGEAETIRNFLLLIEDFRTCDCKQGKFCKKHC